MWIDLAGVRTKAFLFTLWLSCSGTAVHRVFASQGQEAFLEGHVHAFDVLGGVPTDKIRYDNLKCAVSRVLFGRSRVESARWVAFRSHYGFDAFYCQPGVEGAHEKGGVEGEVGRFRRTHLVPVPVVATLAELNARIEAADLTDLARRVENRTRTVGQDLALERALLARLPAEEFDIGLELTPRVDRYARISVRQCRYSVPAGLIGARVRVALRASELIVFAAGAEVARHPRATVRGSEALVLDHYLEVLARKPGALPGATALAQTRAAGSFTATHDRWWAAARTALGDAGGTRALIEVLLLHRHLPHDAVVAGLSAALTLRATSPDVVAVEARKAARTTQPPTIPPPGGDDAPAGQVVAFPVRPAPGDQPGSELPADARALPSVAGYDALLTRRETGT